MPFPVLKINVLQKYNGGSDYVLLQLLNGSMKGKIYTIIGFLALAFTLCCHDLIAQPPPKFNRCFFNPEGPVYVKINYDSLWIAAKTEDNYPLTRSHSVGTFTKIVTLSPQASMASWGWFCHAEHRFRQTTKIPLFVRLGSVEQANRLEGK
jgi:hypothetical protein